MADAWQVEDLGLSAVPHVSPVESFDPSRQMLVLVASDGVWDVASAERVVQVGPLTPFLRPAAALRHWHLHQHYACTFARQADSEDLLRVPHGGTWQHLHPSSHTEL